MKTVRFTTHALERASQRFWNNCPLNVAESTLAQHWDQSAAKLRHSGKFEERWLLPELGMILVCVVEAGARICKTILRAPPSSELELDEEPATVPAPATLDATLVIKLEVDYTLQDAATNHSEIQTYLEDIAARSFKGSMNSKAINVTAIRHSSARTFKPLDQEDE